MNNLLNSIWHLIPAALFGPQCTRDCRPWQGAEEWKLSLLLSVLCVCSQVYINKYFLLHSALISKRLSLTTKQIGKGDKPKSAFFILCTLNKIQTADGNVAVAAVGGGDLQGKMFRKHFLTLLLLFVCLIAPTFLLNETSLSCPSDRSAHISQCALAFPGQIPSGIQE